MNLQLALGAAGEAEKAEETAYALSRLLKAGVGVFLVFLEVRTRLPRASACPLVDANILARLPKLIRQPREEAIRLKEERRVCGMSP